MAHATSTASRAQESCARKSPLPREYTTPDEKRAAARVNFDLLERLPPSADAYTRAVLMAFAAYCGRFESGQAFPSVATIAALAGCSEREVRERVDVLEGLGVLFVERRPGKSSVYRIAWPTPAPRADDQRVRKGSVRSVRSSGKASRPRARAVRSVEPLPEPMRAPVELTDGERRMLLERGWFFAVSAVLRRPCCTDAPDVARRALALMLGKAPDYPESPGAVFQTLVYAELEAERTRQCEAAERTKDPLRPPPPKRPPRAPPSLHVSVEPRRPSSSLERDAALLRAIRGEPPETGPPAST